MENQSKKTTEQKPEKSKNVAVYGLLVELGIEFALMIGLPLFAFIKLGQWLDNRQGTGYFVLIGILLAIALSSYMIYKRAKTVKNILK